jgi:hypothetical protein
VPYRPHRRGIRVQHLSNHWILLLRRWLLAILVAAARPAAQTPKKPRPDKNKAEKHTNPAILPIAYGMMDVWINEVPIGLEQNTMHVTQTVTSGLDTAPIPSKNPAFHPSSNPNRKATGQLPHTKGNNKAKTCHLQT